MSVIQHEREYEIYSEKYNIHNVIRGYGRYNYSAIKIISYKELLNE